MVRPPRAIPTLPAVVPPPTDDAEYMLRFKRRHRLTSTDIARVLGVGERRVSSWSAGQEPIDSWGRLALEAYDTARTDGWSRTWTSADVKSWKDAHRLSNKTAADLLDIGTRRFAGWSSGEEPVPTWAAAAMTGYSLSQRQPAQ